MYLTKDIYDTTGVVELMIQLTEIQVKMYNRERDSVSLYLDV